jgi:hypothetical protein
MTIAAVTTATDGHQTTGIRRLFGNARAAWIAAGLLFIGLLAVLPFALTHFRRTETESPSLCALPSYRLRTWSALAK